MRRILHKCLCWVLVIWSSNKKGHIIITQKPNLLYPGPDGLGELDWDRDLDFDLDLEEELELLERDLERLREWEERLLDLDEEDDDELLPLRRFFLLGGEPDLDRELLKKGTIKINNLKIQFLMLKRKVQKPTLKYA